MVKIALDAGHGRGTSGKQSPDGEHEWDFNSQVVEACTARLKMYGNVEVLRVDDPTGKKDVPLGERTSKANAWKADVYVAIHHNASTGAWGKWTGVETYTFNGQKASSKSTEIAKLVQPRIAKAMGLADRGVHQANFHVLRETNMPAVLTEGGFMDSIIDIQALRSADRLRAQGEAIADALAVYFTLQKKPVETQPSLPAEEYEKEAPPSPGFAEEFQAAIDLGITNGTYPQRPATREEVAVMIVRALRSLEK
ncbi:N-acetylmuramoyl-L-alanine amidase [Sporosarcina sp. Te-1]|uniref:N-acetylmuramoyl-L-alanine amidase family protein n=1 Tax=Sporosarcina sp. Te-1 TaxID=2818390 RepID=UPI001A9EF8DC|nr:N-acetylmuramoyl-L-alanine amidase [Sporosarcina sp. Te-1]QTD40940.1 N-acetylmuramoyl-L-alanine amidase [Sporosarcina sp. Te-1]